MAEICTCCNSIGSLLRMLTKSNILVYATWLPVDIRRPLNYPNSSDVLHVRFLRQRAEDHSATHSTIEFLS